MTPKMPNSAKNTAGERAEKSGSLPAEGSNATAFPASGCWINILDPIIGELVGGCGYDYAMIDMEHSPAGIDQSLNMIRAVQLGGAKALVRVPDKQPRWIGRVMDMGADGVMVPMVETAAEAQLLASAAVFAPQGSRGMAASIVRASGYGVHTEEYLESYRRNFMLLVQIETQMAVDAALEIASVDGVDCVFIGPYDLSGSLGHQAQPDHEVTRKAIRRVNEAAKTAGKCLATLTTPALNASQLLADGYDLIFSGSDVSMLRQAMLGDAASWEKDITAMPTVDKDP